MIVTKPELKIKNETRKDKHPSIVQPTLEAIVSLPSIQDVSHWREDAPIVECAELTLSYGDIVAYVRGLYLDRGDGLCVVCTSYLEDNGQNQKSQAIPVSKIFRYTSLVSSGEEK